MKLEDIVTSLKLSKHLDELGIKQKSFFYWHYLDENCYSVKFITSKTETSGTRIYSAFTASELIEFFPSMISTIRNHDKKFMCAYERSYHLDYIEDDNEANCRAKILIYLIENKLLDPKKV